MALENRKIIVAGGSSGIAPLIAVGRVGQPDEIAHAILFLTENEYMTGKVIGCDGGLLV
jgi:NAD(P)-dependent dehydrogenase (short-subunit alcohol dehydrogenase family)